MVYNVVLRINEKQYILIYNRYKNTDNICINSNIYSNNL